MDRNELPDFEKSGHLLLCLSPKLQLCVSPTHWCTWCFWTNTIQLSTLRQLSFLSAFPLWVYLP